MKTNEAIPFSWIFNYLERFPKRWESPSYSAIVEMFYEYCKEIQDVDVQIEKTKNNKI